MSNSNLQHIHQAASVRRWERLQDRETLNFLLNTVPKFWCNLFPRVIQQTKPFYRASHRQCKQSRVDLPLPGESTKHLSVPSCRCRVDYPVTLPDPLRWVSRFLRNPSWPWYFMLEGHNLREDRPAENRRKFSSPLQHPHTIQLLQQRNLPLYLLLPLPLDPRNESLHREDDCYYKSARGHSAFMWRF